MVPPAYSRALPIHAKTGREWEPDNARSLNGRRDEEMFGVRVPFQLLTRLPKLS